MRQSSFFSTMVVFLALFLSGVVFSKTKTVEERDPYEKINRTIFEFNRTLDKYFLKPVAVSYDTILPSFARQGISTVFSNVSDVPSGANALLQGKVKKTGRILMRIGINATLGFFGIFDVAKDMGLPQEKENFGQTLGVWGVPEGPYLVVPFLGSYTMRSGAGAVVDIYFDPIFVDNVADRNALFAIRTIDKRANLLKAENLIMGDPYIFIRNLYLQQSEYELNDGQVEDAFSGEEDFDDEDDWLDGEGDWLDDESDDDRENVITDDEDWLSD
ncbi:MAG: VacJ family lipoprotein [Cellvibrionales bacterium]|nr:VacJ family lipoprotein [Cellvibrionales bacterium]